MKPKERKERGNVNVNYALASININIKISALTVDKQHYMNILLRYIHILKAIIFIYQTLIA